MLKISNLTFTASVQQSIVLDIFTINSIRGGIKPHFNQASVLKITNFDRPTSHEYRHVVSLLVCTVVCAKH